MTQPSYQDRLDQAGGDPIKLLSTPIPPFTPEFFPIVQAFSNWRDEQKAWMKTATLFEQRHMSDLYMRGPDVMRLLSDTATNSFANFGVNKAKQYVALGEDGYVVGDGILFGLSEEEVSLAGSEILQAWLQYQAKTRGYDVSFVHEPSFALSEGGDSRGGPPVIKKRVFRYMIEGPKAWKILDKAHGGALERTGFFRMSEFTIKGIRVRALNHTMGGVPGDENTGLELFGRVEEEPVFLEALLAAGREYGLVRGGSISYLSTSAESGWVPNPLPPIFAASLRPFRESLAAHTAFFTPIIGSFRSGRIEDYYVTPWDLGYGRSIKFDHDFIGRAALERTAKNPPRRKVWLIWNREDTARVIASSQIDGDDRAKPLVMPINMFTYDQVLVGDRRVGLAFVHGYTVNIGVWVSLATVNSELADGTEVELLWGEPDGGASNPFVASHKQTKIRATISQKSPVKHAS
jgi:glycine cleavage system aminomethyltransferase T